MISIMEPSWIETISVAKCPKEDHQSQHNHGRVDQVNHGNVVGNAFGGILSRFMGSNQIFTILGGEADMLTKGSFSQERWTQLTHFFGIDDTYQTHSLYPLGGICILCRLKHVGATRRDAERLSLSEVTATLWTLCLLKRSRVPK